LIIFQFFGNPPQYDATKASALFVSLVTKSQLVLNDVSAKPIKSTSTVSDCQGPCASATPSTNGKGSQGNSHSSPKTKMYIGVGVGVAVGVLLLIILLVVVVYVRHKRKMASEEKTYALLMGG